MSECDHRCADCPFKTKTIGSKGPVDSPFVIVGESPGSRELIAGKPFMGPSGLMLNQVLKEVGFDDLGIEPFVMNALSCYPKDKDIRTMRTASKACQQRVWDTIRQHPRKVILTLGAAAAWSVTNDFKIAVTRDRGKMLQAPDLCSDGVVLTVHPAYLMRNGGVYPFWKKDIASSVALFKGDINTEGGFIPPTWSVIESREQYAAMVRKLHNIVKPPMITGDVETDSLYAHTGRMLMLGITWDGDHVTIIPEDILYDNWDITKVLVEQPGPRWNWHNGKFDVRWFRRHGAHARVDEDTMLLSYCLNENRGVHDLDQVAQTYISAPAHKKEIAKYLPNKNTSYRVIPKPELHKYAAYDIAKTHRQWAVMHEMVFADQYLKRQYEKLLIPASNLLPEVEAYGVRVSMTRIMDNERTHEAQIKELDAKINVYAQKHLGHDINIGSWQQLKKLLYGKMGLGRMSDATDEDALIQIKRKFNHPIVDLLLERREIAKRKGTYITNLHDRVDEKGKFIPGRIDEDQRVRATFKLHGTTSGRLAGADPNLLNQPRGPIIRGQYVAGKGKVFVEVDLNQAELRSLAQMSKDPILLDIYTKNEISIHDVTTAAFFGSKKEMKENENIREAARRQLFLGPEFTAEEIYKEAKMRGKAVNFGIVYGREAFSLAEEFNIPVAEAQRWINKWFETYPGAKKFIEECRALPNQRKSITTVFGRRKRPGVVSSENLKGLQNEYANFPHQSVASDIMLTTFIEVYYPLRERWDAYIWNELYDAIYYEVDADADKIAESIAYVQEVITRVPREVGLTRVPFLGDAKIGLDWGHMQDWEGKHTLEEVLNKYDWVD